MEFVI